MCIIIWRRKEENCKNTDKNKFRTKFRTNFQFTIQLEKLEWTPGPWGNYLYLLTASVPRLEGTARSCPASVPLILANSISGSSLFPLPLAPCLPTETSQGVLIK